MMWAIVATLIFIAAMLWNCFNVLVRIAETADQAAETQKQLLAQATLLESHAVTAIYSPAED